MLSLDFCHKEYGTVRTGDFIKQWRFPCGEAGIKLNEPALEFVRSYSWKAAITMQFEGNDDLFALAQLVDAIRHVNPGMSIGLVTEYMPYGRQDRRCNPGEGHGLKVMADFINNLKLDLVGVTDAHSTVTEALFNNLQEIPQWSCADALPVFDVLIAPDAGAEKKIFKHNQIEDGTEVICASKRRDINGKIVGAALPYEAFKIEGQRVCIVDDLCDGGATFLELGKLVKTYRPAELCLYVTHGMFTNPEKFVELNDLFDRIFVYNMSPTANAKYGSYVEQI